MAKIAFTKLGLTKPTEVVTIEVNGQPVEVKTYIPMSDKLDLIASVVNQTVDENDFYNPCKLEVYTKIETILAYTNITVTEKQKSDIYKLYDLMANGLFQPVFEILDNTADYTFVKQGIKETIASVYSFTNSAKGIIDAITKTYDDMEVDAGKIQTALGNPEELALLRDVVSKLS